MKMYDFIFSDRLKYRLSRHLALWLFLCLYIFIVNFFPRSPADLTNPATYLFAFQKMIYIPTGILSVYVFIYYLIPGYLLKSRYFSFFMLIVLLCLVNFALATILTRLLAQLTGKGPFYQLPLQMRVFDPVVYGPGLGMAVGGMAGIIKLLKIRYLKEKENERLLQQKINTELRMIKSNFHPHFLSDSLQNISSLIRGQSKQAAPVILKLSDLLSYILYENDKEYVPLEQELSMMKEYLNLEKTFYGNRIRISMSERGDRKAMIIAPMILLSLVQNCCEQFLIPIQQDLTIELNLIAENRQFIFLLKCNGYYESANGTPETDNSLGQSLRRIQMLYPGRHRLETEMGSGFFSMNLVLGEDVLFKTAQSTAKEKQLHELA